MGSVTYTCSFSSNLAFNAHPSAFLSGPSSTIPSGARITNVEFEVYCGVSQYNYDADCCATLTDLSGNTFDVDSTVNTGSSNRIWAAWDESVNETESASMNWNALYEVELSGTDKLTVRTGYTATLTIEYEEATRPSPPKTVTIDKAQTSDSTNVLRWSGASAGNYNPISGYYIQYSDSTDGATWNGWNEYAFIDTASTDVSYTVNMPSSGWYRKFKVYTLGTINGLNSSTGTESPVTFAISYTLCTPPQTVTISASSVAPDTPVTLSWRGAGAGTSNPITRYEIWKATAANGTYQYDHSVVTSSTEGQTTVYSPIENGGTYYYKVKTIGSVAGYDSALSDAYVSLSTAYSAPGVPQNVKIAGETVLYMKSGQAMLTWDAVSAGTNNPVTGYSVYRDGVLYATTTETQMPVPVNATPGGYHTYAVYANGQYASSGMSAEVRVYTYSDVKAPDTVLVNGENAAYVGEGTQVSLSWSGADSGAYNAITGYQVYQDGAAYRQTTENVMLVPASSEAGGEHAYTVSTLGERGNSEPSSAAMVYSYAAVKAPTSVSVSNLSPDAGAVISLYFSGAEPGEYNPIKGYRVYEDVGATGAYQAIATIETAEKSGTYSMNAADDMAITCRYKVSTIGTYGESALSDAFAEYTTKSYGACLPPTSVTIDKNSADTGEEANLYWSGAQDGENSAIARYAVYSSDRSDRDYVKLLETTGNTAKVNASDEEGRITYFKVQSIAEDEKYNSELSDAYAWIKTNITTGFGGNSVPASAAFHAAIRNGAKQRALVYFYDDGLWLTNDDIVSGGITYENYFCSEEDVTIGLTPCSTVSFSIFNENRRLDNMRFGRFRASIGAMTAAGTFEPAVGSNVTAIYDGDVISGHDEYPYVRVNRVGLNDQPDFPVKSIFVMNDRVYCIGENEKFIVYARNLEAERNDVKQYTWQQVAAMTWNDLRSIVWGEDTRFDKDEKGQINALMLAVSERYAQRNIGIVVEADDTITDYLPTGKSETYTYVDLGIFFADRPARTRTNIITVDGYDGMSKFDVSTEDMAIAFPITLYGLLNTVCAFVGIEHKVERFANQDIVLTQASDIFQSTTAREILGYIAECASANAKIDYDGKLMFAWWSETGLVLNESDYATFVPYEYTVKPIDKLQIRSGEDDIGILVGEGVNGYVIQENPFLTFESDAQGQVVAAPIYEILSFFPEYTPGSADWFGDWSYRPGDVITVSYGGVSYRYPIFGYTLEWAGNAMIRLESTGNEYREVLDASSREKYAVGRKMLQINKSIDGVRLIASEAKQTSEGASEKVAELNLTVDGLNTKVTKVETGQEELESQFNQTAEQIEAKVSKGEVIAAINLTAEAAKIQAPKISLEGLVTANENFRVLLDGSIEAKNGSFSGDLSSGNWKFDSSGALYKNGDQKVNMAVLTGSFVGGGSGTRAFFGSSGMDVQYGADYDMNAYVRAGNVIIVAQNKENMDQYATAHFVRSSTGQMSIVCGESTGASADDTNAKGNLGLATQYWDYTFTRVLRASVYPGDSSRAVKQDIEPMEDMGDAIDRLEPVMFAYKKAPNTKRYGLIYEDVKPVLPVVCFDDGENTPGIVYTDLVPVLLKEIKSLRERVKALEERM